MEIGLKDGGWWPKKDGEWEVCLDQPIGDANDPTGGANDPTGGPLRPRI